MRYTPVVVWILILGCTADGQTSDEKPAQDADADTDTDADSDTDADADTDTDSDTDTPTTGYGQPTLLAVNCVAQVDNVLRYDCTVNVEPAQPVQLTFSRVDGLGALRVVSSADVLTDHVLPMYFMAPAQEYEVVASAIAWPADLATASVTTALPPPIVATALSITGASTMGMIGTHLPCTDDAIAVVYDTATGDLLWYQGMDPGGNFGSLDMVQFTDDHTVLGESNGDVIEVDLMGADILRLNDLDDAFGVTAGGIFGDFHHDIMKRDGVYYVFYQESYGGGGFFSDILDTVILFDGTGTELARWDPIDHLTLPANWSGDFLHTNTVFVDTSGDILLSWLNQDTIAKIEGDWTSATFGEPIWILRGRAGGEVGNTITTDWSGVGAPGYFDSQHSLFVRPDGMLQVLDNGNGRGLVIDLDEVTSTAAVIGAYDTHENSCGPQGTSRSTLAGNPIVGCAGDWVREFDFATGAQLWEAEVQCGSGDPVASRWYALDGW